MSTGHAPGQLLDERYTLDHELHEDAYGTIWEAFDRGLSRSVCLRDVAMPGHGPHDARLRDTLRYARAAIRLDHQGAIHVYDAFIDGDRLIIVNELSHAPSLDTVVSRKRPLPERRVAAIGFELVEPLAAAHALGLVHGSIGPASVLMPEKARPLLSGFGLSPELMTAAPQHVPGGNGTAAADVWSLGATLYFAVAGEYPDDEPVAPPRAPKLWPLLQRMLATDPEARPAPGDLRREFAGVAGIPLDDQGRVLVPETRRRRRNRRRPAENEAEAEAAVEAAIGEHMAEDMPGDATATESTDAGATASGDRDWEAVVTEDRPDSPDAWVDWSPPADQTNGETATTEAALANVDAAPAAAAPDATAEVEKGEEEPRYRSTLSWPPERGRRSWIIFFLCGLVIVVMVALLVTNGYFGRPRNDGAALSRPELQVDRAAVPADWIAYDHPVVDFRISYPPGWTLREEGTLLTITDPVGGTQLRVDARTPAGQDPYLRALEAERNFSIRHPETYKRLQMSPATYLGHHAALWEYSYHQQGPTVHVAEMAFNADEWGITMIFEAPDQTWQELLPTFRGFLASVQA